VRTAASWAVAPRLAVPGHSETEAPRRRRGRRGVNSKSSASGEHGQYGCSCAAVEMPAAGVGEREEVERRREAVSISFSLFWSEMSCVYVLSLPESIY
jgi:hypothetical protein